MLPFAKYVRNFLWPSLPYPQIDWYNRSFGKELRANTFLKGHEYNFHQPQNSFSVSQSFLTSPTSRLSAHKALIIKPLYSVYYIYNKNELGVIEHHFNPLAILDPRRFVDMSFEFLHGLCDLLAQVDHNPTANCKKVSSDLDWPNRSGLSRFCLVISGILRFPVSLAQTVWNTFAHPFDTHLLPYVQIYRVYKRNKLPDTQAKISNGKLVALAVLHTIKTGLMIACVASVVGQPFIPVVTGFFSSVANFVTGGVLSKIAGTAASLVVSSQTAPVIANAVVTAAGAQVISNGFIPMSGVESSAQVRGRFNHDMTSNVDKAKLLQRQSEMMPSVVSKKQQKSKPGQVIDFLRRARQSRKKSSFPASSVQPQMVKMQEKTSATTGMLRRTSP